MFLSNKYTRWYFVIVNRASNRDPKSLGCIEWHHATPKSLGGTNECKVALTPREHFICHLLLVKMLDGKAKTKMFWALHRMMFSENEHQIRYKASSRTYDNFKRSFYESLRKPRNITEQHRENIVKANKKNKTGVALSDAHREAMSLAKMGKTLSEEHKTAIGAGHKGKVKDEAHRAKIGDSLRGRTVPDEVKAKLSKRCELDGKVYPSIKALVLERGQGKNGAKHPRLKFL